MFTSTSILFLLSTLTFSPAKAAFSACPLLGPRFPIPKSTASSPIIQESLQNLTQSLDAYLATGDGDFGPITPNTTSFSIALFSTEEGNSTEPYSYEYHYTAPAFESGMLGEKEVDASTVYQVGDLTTLFTTWLFLLEAGEEYWSAPISKYVPELAEGNSSSTSSISKVDWGRITLGDLAAHLGGIGRYIPTANPPNPTLTSLLESFDLERPTSPCAIGSSSCGRSEWLHYFNHHAPVVAPASTPIFSNAGFIILAYALETITNKSYADLLHSSILKPLNLSSTFLLQDHLTPETLRNTTAVEAPYNGLTSTTHDLSTAFHALFSSALLDPPTTARWLKPVSLTSNSANSVGRPWEIYSLTVDGPSPVIPVYQVRGSIGHYSSHMGLVPDYGVGFVILGVDSQMSPDLNAYADLVSVALVPGLEENAIMQASGLFAGRYVCWNVSLVVEPAEDETPGMAVSNFTSGGVDVFAVYAELNGVERGDLSFRLYPTGLVEESGGSTRTGFRALFQDVNALADAGTPTCDTWRYVDERQIGGVGLDEFIFELSPDGNVTVEVPALQAKMLKETK